MSILLSASAVDALAATEVRLVHALPGGPAASLLVRGGAGPDAKIEGVRFGEASDYARVPLGRVDLTLNAGDDEVGRRSSTLRTGRFTVLASRNDAGGATLRVIRDGEAVAGRARLRAVHAAPEIDNAEFLVGDRVLGRLGEGRVTGYKTFEPGSYPVVARRPGSREAMVEQPRVNLAAGTSATAFLVGSGGERTRFVVAEDSAATPDRAPATGLGGLSGEDTPWIAALMAALLAGGLGGGVYLRAAGRGRAAS